MLYNDYLSDPSNAAFDSVPAEVRDLDYDKSLSDKTIEKAFMGLSKQRFAERIQPGIKVPTMCGNMYTASVYGSLVSLISNVAADQLQGRRVGIFSYGSGLASSFFSLQVKGDVSDMVAKVDLDRRLEGRRTVDPAVYDEVSAKPGDSLGAAS